MVEEIHLTSVETSNSGDVKVGLFGDEWIREVIESTPQNSDNEHPTTYMILILLMGHSLAMNIDLKASFEAKVDKIMQRPARKGRLGIRVTEYTDS